MSDYERKFVRCELKLEGEHTFSGIASPYGNTDLGGDIVLKGAFTRTLELMGNERPLLWQHRSDSPIGIGEFVDSEKALLLKQGTLEMALDDAKKAHVSIKSRIVKGLSIGYIPVKWSWQKSAEADGWPTRLLEEVKLYEVSIVTFPMNESAVITSVKSTDTALAFWTSEIKAGRLDRSLVVCQLEKLTALLAEKREPASSLRDPGDHSRIVGLLDQSKELLYGKP